MMPLIILKICLIGGSDKITHWRFSRSTNFAWLPAKFCNCLRFGSTQSMLSYNSNSHLQDNFGHSVLFCSHTTELSLPRMFWSSMISIWANRLLLISWYTAKGRSSFSCVRNICLEYNNYDYLNPQFLNYHGQFEHIQKALRCLVN